MASGGGKPVGDFGDDMDTIFPDHPILPGAGLTKAGNVHPMLSPGRTPVPEGVAGVPMLENDLVFL